MPRRICKSCGKTIVISQYNWKYCHDKTDFLCSKECVVLRIKQFYNPFCKPAAYNIAPYFDVNDSITTAYSSVLDKYFRSEFEVGVAEFLYNNSFDFLYEPFVFEFDSYTIVPDFYILPPYDCFIEVKGVFGIGKKGKLTKFLRAFPNLNFIFIPWTMRGEFVNVDG